jgi:hypothetical protein
MADLEHRPKYKDGDYIFDGFMHRPYDESLDGWRNEVISSSEYLCLEVAESTLDLKARYNALVKEHWALQKELKHYKDLYNIRNGKSA